jgi:hypothetical protein
MSKVSLTEGDDGRVGFRHSDGDVGCWSAAGERTSREKRNEPAGLNQVFFHFFFANLFFIIIYKYNWGRM